MQAAPANLNLTRLTGAIGAVVEGLDLAQPLQPPTRAALEGALVEHQVLFFRDQRLTPVTQRDFAANFGALHIHPLYPPSEEAPEVIVLDTHPGNPPDSAIWHSDVPFIETPPMGSVLAAKLLPPVGGDTLWLSCRAAFAALSPPLQRMLDGLMAENDFTKSFDPSRYTEAQWQAAKRKNPPVAHPVVRRHPVTGAPGLYVNESFTTRILGVTPKESDALLRFLFAHLAQPEFVVRWHWRLGDVAFFDNRLTQHYATADYLPHRRVMHRATILGDKPR